MGTFCKTSFATIVLLIVKLAIIVLAVSVVEDKTLGILMEQDVLQYRDIMRPTHPLPRPALTIAWSALLPPTAQSVGKGQC